MDWNKFLKETFRGRYSPEVDNTYNPGVQRPKTKRGPHYITSDMNNLAALNPITRGMNMSEASALYGRGGPTRPVAPATQPGSPAIVEGDVKASEATQAPQPQPAPTPMAVKGPVPTPSFRERNLPGVNDVKPNPLKTMGRELINQMATPGYFDKDRGVWVSSAHAYGDKKAGKTRENKSVEFLKRKGYSQEDAEAIMSNPDLSKEIMKSVVAPKNLSESHQKEAREASVKQQQFKVDISNLDRAMEILDDRIATPGYLTGETASSKVLRTIDKVTGATISTIADPDLKSAMDTTQEIAARNLKEILGGQFARVEGEQLLARTYDPAMSPTENKRRLQALKTSMTLMMAQKESLYGLDPVAKEQMQKALTDQLIANMRNAGVELKSKDGKSSGDSSGGYTYLGEE